MRSVQVGSPHSQTNDASSAAKLCALSAMRSFTSRNSDSVVVSRVLERSSSQTRCAITLPTAMSQWPPEVERVASFLRMAAVDARLEEFMSGTPTAAEAARAIGCDLSQIVKSLVFVCDG